MYGVSKISFKNSSKAKGLMKFLNSDIPSSEGITSGVANGEVKTSRLRLLDILGKNLKRKVTSYSVSR